MGVDDLVRLMIILKCFCELLLEYGKVIVARPLTGILRQTPRVYIQKSVNTILIFQTCIKSFNMYLIDMQFRILVTTGNQGWNRGTYRSQAFT